MNKIHVNPQNPSNPCCDKNQKIPKYLYSNCFLLFIPVILFNIVFTKYLPEQYLQNISHSIIPIENISRILLMALSAIMIIDVKSRTGKIGISIYITGLIIYFLSYFLLINYSDAVVGNNIILQLSGYWTAMIWLIGIGLVGVKLFVKVPYHCSFFLILSILFGILHTYHGYILIG